MIPIKINNKYGYLDMSGNKIIPFNFKYAENFSCGMACISDDKSEYYINKTGKPLFNLKFSNATSFEDNIAIVSPLIFTFTILKIQEKNLKSQS